MAPRVKPSTGTGIAIATTPYESLIHIVSKRSATMHETTRRW